MTTMTTRIIQTWVKRCLFAVLLLPTSVSVHSATDSLYYAAQLDSAAFHALMADSLKQTEILLEQATGILSRHEPSQRTRLWGFVFNHWGLFYQRIAQYARSGYYFDKALRCFSKHSDEYMLVYSSRAEIYDVQSQFLKAYDMLEHVIKHYEHKRHAPDHLLAARLNMAKLLAANDYHEEALYELRQVKKQISPQHPYYGVLCNDMAFICESLGHNNQAERMYDQALAFYRGQAQSGEQCHIVRHNAACFYEHTNQIMRADSIYRIALDEQKQTISDAFCFLSEQERNRLWQSRSHLVYQTYPRFALDYFRQYPQVTELAYDNELFAKGILLSAATLLKNTILSSGDQALVATYTRLQALKQQILMAELQPLNMQESLDSLRRAANALDRQLALHSADYRNGMQERAIRYTHVRERLKQTEAAIEFSAVPIDDDTVISTQLVAWLLRHDSPYPVCIPLCTQEQIQALLDYDPAITYTANGDELYRLLWLPIANHLHDCTTIYMAVAGILHQLNMAALPCPDMSVVGDNYDIISLTSTRELVLTRAPYTTNHAALFGGVLYDPDSVGRIKGGVKHLPHTKREVETIAGLLNGHGVSADMYIGRDATEQQFKALSAIQPRLLHVATHGFFYTNDGAQKRQCFRPQLQLLSARTHSQPFIDPLMRSGLLLDNANVAWTGHDDAPFNSMQDGILTAKEISLIDLRGLDLVVLSACQTARGDITGEGVFGLQRGFKQAGAQTIVMSLWKVDDTATAYLMTQFYTALTDGQSKRQAFRTAVARTRARFPSPYYWAAFVMMD